MIKSKICVQCGAEFGPEQRFCPNDGRALRPTGSDDPLIGQLVADRYQILELLGEGGMGRVYLAEHVRMGRKSAVKVMSPTLALSADAVSRFNREAANASRINHPNVAQIYDFGETAEGTLYLAMEFVEGDTLSTILHRDGPIAPRRAADLIKQIADALGAAHHLDIVHRDLKPDNVMVSRHHDGADWVKVVDFGIAKTIQRSGESAASQTVTTAGVSLGTPEYMSPEQLAGERLDSRTDLYSLGLVLFNMLTGDLPYPRVTSKETLVRRLTSRPRTLADVAPKEHWPAALQTALDRALAPETGDRYASVADFGRDVIAAVSGLADPDQTVRIPRPAPVQASSAPTRRIELVAARASRPRRPPIDHPSRKPSLIAAGALLVVCALGAGAFVAFRHRSEAQALAAPTSTIKPDTTARRPDSSPTVASVATAPGKLGTDTATRSNTPEPTKNANRVEPKPSTAPAAVDSATASPPVVAPQPAASAADGVPDSARVRLLGETIQGHLLRAKQLVQQGEIGKARGEFRDAAPVLGVLRQLYPTAPGEQRVEQMVRLATVQSVAACRLSIADSAARSRMPPNFRCEQLIPLGLRPPGRGARERPASDERSLRDR